MPQAILRYHKGINQDIDKNTLTDGNYFTLKNGRVISDKQLSQGSVTTIRGNVKIIDIPDGHRIKAQWQFATSSSVPTLSITALGVTTVFTSSALTPELKADDLVNQINISDKPYKAFFIEATSVFYITPLVHTTTISITSSGISEFALDSSDYFNINGTKPLGDYLTIVDGWTTQVPVVRGYGIQGDRLILFCQVTIEDVDNLAIYSIKFGGISIDVKLAYFCSNWKFGTIMNESIVHYESDNVFTIYWLNVIDEAPSPIYTLNLNADDSYFTPKSMLNIVPDVRLCEPMLTDIQLGGKLKVGKIQYSYCLYKKYGQESNYSPFSGLFHLTDKPDKGDYQRYCGSPRYEDGTTTSRSANKTVLFNIPDVDQNYTHIKVVSIWYDTLNGAPICNIIADKKISGTSMSFVDTGDSLGDISIETILTKKTRIRCKTITEKNNILFAGNIEEESTYIQALEDYDTRAYRFTSWRLGGIFSELKPAEPFDIDTNDNVHYWSPRPNKGYTNPLTPLTKDYLLNGSSETWKADAALIPKEHNCVNRFNDVSDYIAQSVRMPDGYDVMYQSDGVTLGGEGINIKYKFTEETYTGIDNRIYQQTVGGVRQHPNGNTAVVLSQVNATETDQLGFYNTNASPYISAYNLSLERDELYAVGISWKLRDGTDYPAKWIGDIRTTRWLESDLADVDTTNLKLNHCVCTFTVSIPVELCQYIQGYTIVSCKRDSDNRTVRSIGLLNQLKTNRYAPSTEGAYAFEQNNRLSNIEYKFVNQRYIDGIRHPRFTVSDRPTWVLLGGRQDVDTYYGNDGDNYGQRRSDVYEYICPELAFNANYEYSQSDKMIPIQVVRVGTYFEQKFVNSDGTMLAGNATGLGDWINLTDDCIRLDDTVTPDSDKMSYKTLLSAQKIFKSSRLSAYPYRVDDSDYRKGFKILELIIPDPAESLTLINRRTSVPELETYRHSWIDKQILDKEWKIIAESKHVSGCIVRLDPFSTNVLATDNQWYNKHVTENPLIRDSVIIYTLHRKCFYPYLGPTYEGRQNRTYYKSSIYTPINMTSSIDQVYSTRMIGDTFTIQYQHIRNVSNPLFTGQGENLGPYYDEIKPHTHVITYPTTSSVNTELRMDTDIPRYSSMANINSEAGLNQKIDLTGSGGILYPYAKPVISLNQYLFDYTQKRDLNLYNTVYSLVRGWDVYLPLPYNTSDTTKFPTRMVASNNKMDDELIDSWTQVSVFKDKDLEVKYGEIVDLIVWKDRLFAIQETGIATVAVNERSAVSGASGETLNLAVADVFSYHQYSSTYTGTKFKYKFGIVSAPEVLYLYDSNRSVMAYLSQSDENASLSDVKGLYSWFDLNLQPENITYIQSVYDTNYNEILTSIECGSTVTTIVFSEKMLTYEMFLKHVRGVINIGTPARLLSWQMNAMAKSVVWQHNIGKENMLWGTYYPLNLSAVFTSRGKMERYHGLINSIMLLDNVEFIADVSNMDGHTIETKYIDNESITSIRAYNSYQDTGVMSLVDSDKKLISRLIMRFARKWRMNKFWDILRPNKYRPDVTIRDSYVQVDMQFNGKLYDETAITNRSLQLSDVTVNYRELNQTQY